MKKIFLKLFKQKSISIVTVDIETIRAEQQGQIYLKVANTEVRSLGWFDYLTHIGFVKSTSHPKGHLEFGAWPSIEGRSKFYPRGYSLCRGVIGETWPKKTDVINKQMEPISDADQNGWVTYKPKSINTCFAYKIDYDFRVVALNSTILTGKAGDYLVDNGTDQWIVRGDIFEKSYILFHGMS